ncbi:long-chain-fatty-acid--coa ligase [hydrocarbon metagenome]|uniref:Long-chain-fatty-acid--coa ligase n=1 Tax=hydrocarbon metagenome TaxID=938273 RepID=A0A0W8FQS2_9ZZZZ
MEVIKTINLIQLFRDSVQKHYDRTAFISEKQYITYSQLNRAVNSVAGIIKQSGIGKGDNVAVMLPNIPEFVYSYFGVLKTGAAVVPLNTSSTAFELTYLLNNSDSKILITQTSQIKKYQEAKDKLISCHQVIAIDSLNQNGELCAGAESDDSSSYPEKINPEDPAVIVYTAGLTGKPLGAILTHGNLCEQMDMIQPIFRRGPDDVGLCLIPLFHTFGATVNMLNVIQAGCSTVMMDRLTMESFFGAIEREKITYIAAVPRLYVGMIFYEKASKYDLSSLKICVTGGSAMPPDFIPVFEQKFNVRMLEGYGLTEASPACSFNRIESVAKHGSIGTPLTGIDIKIVDDTGRELPRNQIGELIVRGGNVMKGYYKDEAATASVIRDGWLYTGDLGRMDEENYIFLTGLKKRMIITSGFNVYASEVENVLNMHPAVQISSVSGKQDLMRGEVVKAQIVLKEGYSADEKEIIRYCKIYLSNYKVPREVEFIKALPD